MKIVIFTQSPISKAPRVVKEANCLARNGYNVTVYGLWYDATILENDLKLLESSVIYKPGANLLECNLSTMAYRINRRIFRELVKIGGLQCKQALGYGYSKYLKSLVAEKANLYIGHQELSLALAKALIMTGHNVAFDLEDFHSQDLLPKDRVYRPIKLLSSLEDFILKNAVYCTTTSDALAGALADNYKSKIPVTVYNSFHRSQLNKSFNNERKPNSLVWISQVIGPGRGLELIISAIRLSKLSYELTLIGNKDISYCKEILNNLPYNLKIEFSDYIPPDQIAQELAKFDVGIAFEDFEPGNKNLTVANKLFHYLNSGIAILASNTAGQSEIHQKTENAIAIVVPNPTEICKVLEDLYSNPEKLALMKAKCKYFGDEVFCFEKEEQKILSLVSSAINKNSSLL